MTIPAWNILSDEDVLQRISDRLQHSVNNDDDNIQVVMRRPIRLLAEQERVVDISIRTLVESGHLSELQVEEHQDDYDGQPYLHVREGALADAIFDWTQDDRAQECPSDHWNLVDTDPIHMGYELVQQPGNSGRILYAWDEF